MGEYANVFWGEWVKCDIGTCPYPNPEGKWLTVTPYYIRFDTRERFEIMGFYIVSIMVEEPIIISLWGQWSYDKLTRDLIYVVSVDSKQIVAKCTVRAGYNYCYNWAVLQPGNYLIALFDAWKEQWVYEEISFWGAYSLVKIMARDAVCTLLSAGLFQDQVLTRAFDWTTKESVQIHINFSDVMCGFE